MPEFYVYKTGSTYRFETKKDSCREVIKDFMDIVSCWGGSDGNNDIYYSWEIDQNIYEFVENVLTIKFYCEIHNRRDGKMYIIATIAQGSSEGEYYSIDERSGYPYWSSFRNAKIFSEFEEAKKTLEGSDFTEEHNMSGGTIYPPRMIHNGARINNKNIKSGMNVYIKRVCLITEYQRHYTGEIKYPKSYNY